MLGVCWCTKGEVNIKAALLEAETAEADVWDLLHKKKNNPIHNWTEVKAFLYYQAVNKTFIAVMLVILFQQSVGSYLFINSFIYYNYYLLSYILFLNKIYSLWNSEIAPSMGSKH